MNQTKLKNTQAATSSNRPVLPGFGLSLGITVSYVSLLVLLPIAALLARMFELSPADFFRLATSPRVLSAYWLSFVTAFGAALINLVFGTLLAWVLVRYTFPGKGLIDSMIDLPFALPTAVAGIALTSLYVPGGAFGSVLQNFNIKAAYAPLGILIALTFVGLPFIVRSVQPVLEDLDPEMEQAAATLGAGRLRAFCSVIFPNIWPSMLAGFSLAFARALGEYGSVVFISGNLPFRTEIVPLLIMARLEQFDYRGAAVLGVVMLLASFLLLILLNFLRSFKAVKMRGAL